MRIISLYILLNISSICWSQSLSYDILFNGHDIGELISTSTRNGNMLDILVTSKVTAKIVITIEVEYIMKSKFIDNELYYSSVTTYLNENQRSSTTVLKKDGYYLVTSGDESWNFNGKIMYSEAMMCFSEPKNHSSIFSEYVGLNKPISKIDMNKYRLLNPLNNNYADNIYSNGILQKSTVHYTLATFIIQKKNP